MPRTTDAAVKQIIDTALDTMPFIQTASLLVTTYLGAVGLSEPLLSEIERWWAAHLITIREPRVHEVRMGETDTTFVEGELGMGLASSFYGQTVLSLDSSRTLKTMEATASLRPAWVRID